MQNVSCLEQLEATDEKMREISLIYDPAELLLR